MHFKKRSIIILSILLLLIVAVFGFVYSRSVWRAERAIGNLLRQIEREGINEISLTVYYILPATGRQYQSIRSLVDGGYHYRIFVEGFQMEEHIDALRRIGDINLTSTERRTRVSASMHYVFRDKHNRRILDVTMFGSGGRGGNHLVYNTSVFVNGVEVEWDDIFIEIIYPFLSEDRARWWEEGIKR